ncbi:ferritin-like domain-domain-containing protein [Tuber borchii]|uniref:Ferritin-like domain-domain-containing protein n=1 Tax=Tuber borchii TaxID=42251 RepID=A0A2T6ZNQ5_TUBBO|nr:ferritin-like domain-domain-containing protein [Tuber borchii]
MYFPTKLALAATVMTIPAAINAAPLSTRDHINDGIILNYALTLEHLENAFYTQGLKNFSSAAAFSSFPPTLFPVLQGVASDEKTHVQFLEAALAAAKIPAVKPCTYSFPVTTAEEFVLVSGILEGVGVTAYLGAAASIADGLTLTAAGSILTVEARHNSLIRAAQGRTAAAQAFDVPLDFNEVVTLATPFIVSCPPENPPLPFKAFPTLALAKSYVGGGGYKIKAGSKISLAPGAKTQKDGLSVAFLTVTGPIFVDAVFVDGHDDAYGHFDVVVPAGVNGQSYAVLVTGRDTVTDENTVAGPAIIEISN